MGVIVLEGPDGAGKSTLGEAISKRLGVELGHDGGPSRDGAHCIERIVMFGRLHNALRDRSTLFSDAIYKRALGLGEPYVNQRDIDEHVRRIAAVQNTLMIYVRPPADVLLKNTDALARSKPHKPHKPPEYAKQVKQNLPLLIEEYDKNVRRWSALGLPIIHYDYTADRVEEVLTDVQLFWESRWDNGHLRS
jgi:hypothetical protein